MYTGRRDTAHTVLMRGTIGVWTPNNIWGDTAHTFLLMGSIWVGTLRNIRGDTAHTFLMRGTIGVGTLHNIEGKSLAVGVWVEGPLLIWEVATAYMVGGPS